MQSSGLTIEMRTDTIRVLLVSNVYPVDDQTGTPSIGIQQRLLAERGVEFDVISIQTGNPIAYVKAAIKFLLMNLTKPKNDLVHAYYGLSAYISLLQKRMPVVATFLGSDLLSEGVSKHRDILVSTLAAKKADAVIVMTEDMKKASGREDAHVIPFGVSLSRLPLIDQADARHQLGMPLDKKLVLFPWDPVRLVKRFDIVEKMMQLVKGMIPQSELVVVHDKPHATIATYFNACDVCVLASDHEGSPVAIREALACNLPVVSVDVGDVGELIEGLENCYLADKNPADMAEKVSKVLNSGMRCRGRERMQAYDMHHSADRVWQIYQQLIDAKNRPGFTGRKG
jgi:teichuronic acid biosynthesis glycosyltransferase TuaC